MTTRKSPETWRKARFAQALLLRHRGRAQFGPSMYLFALTYVLQLQATVPFHYSLAVSLGIVSFVQLWLAKAALPRAHKTLALTGRDEAAQMVAVHFPSVAEVVRAARAPLKPALFPTRTVINRDKVAESLAEYKARFRSAARDFDSAGALGASALFLLSPVLGHLSAMPFALAWTAQLGLWASALYVGNRAAKAYVAADQLVSMQALGLVARAAYADRFEPEMSRGVAFATNALSQAAAAVGSILADAMGRGPYTPPPPTPGEGSAARSEYHRRDPNKRRPQTDVPGSPWDGWIFPPPGDDDKPN